MTKNTAPTPYEPSVEVPKFITRTGKFLQAVSPRLATKFARFLFLKPLKHKLPKREKYMDETSRQELLMIPSINKEVMMYRYGSGKRKILLAHGWSGRGTQLVKIADHFIAKGFETISFDAPAHGKAPGKSTSMLEFIEAIIEIDKQYGPFEFAIGHSLGGMALLNAIREGVRFKKLVTIGAADVITEIIYNFNTALGLKESIARRMKAGLDREFGRDIDYASAHKAAEAVDFPTLVIHDENDADVHVHCAYAIHQALDQSELFITQKLGHRRILGNKKVIERIDRFLHKE